jgi:hypothetical protein
MDTVQDMGVRASADARPQAGLREVNIRLVMHKVVQLRCNFTIQDRGCSHADIVIRGMC